MKVNDLIPKLLEATKKKKLSWSQVMDDAFVAKISKRTFRVTSGFDDDSEGTYYRFDIYEGKDGALFESQFIDGVYADRFKGAYSDLDELYAEARRNALGLDKVMSEIDDELDKLLM